MKQIDINPDEIGVWCSNIKVHEGLLEGIIKRDGWKNIPRVPVFELPEGYKHKYVLIDGHARHNAATNTKTMLPCNAYVCGEEINAVRDGLAPFKHAEECSTEKAYRQFIRMYEFFEGIEPKSS